MLSRDSPLSIFFIYDSLTFAAKNIARKLLSKLVVHRNRRNNLETGILIISVNDIKITTLYNAGKFKNDFSVRRKSKYIFYISIRYVHFNICQIIMETQILYNLVLLSKEIKQSKRKTIIITTFYIDITNMKG